MSASEPKGCLGAFLDLQFNEFVTRRFISILYVIALIVILLAAVIGVVSGIVTLFNDAGQGLLLILASIIGAIVYIILTRIWLELIVVVFKIAENTSELVRLKEAERSSAASAAGQE
ncbi:MAG: DUF4282 domain-containing protein [Caldilineae bacterium]|nr:MAG: DUF4282 domain-containing protein [Caldilineae bacterium]